MNRAWRRTATLAAVLAALVAGCDTGTDVSSGPSPTLGFLVIPIDDPAGGGDGGSATDAPASTAAPPGEQINQGEKGATVVRVDFEDASDGDDGGGPGGGSRPWDPDMWMVEAPGEGAALVVDGTGHMVVDPRGTHEYVRTIAPGTQHRDAEVLLTLTPVAGDIGTAFITLRGDGEWRDAVEYLPQTGVVVEYGYSSVYEGEVAVTDLSDPAAQDRDAVELGPVPGAGEAVHLRLVLQGPELLVRAWMASEPEPEAWLLRTPVRVLEPGVLQLSYRDGPGGTLGWDDIQMALVP